MGRPTKKRLVINEDLPRLEFGYLYRNPRGVIYWKWRDARINPKTVDPKTGKGKPYGKRERSTKTDSVSKAARIAATWANEYLATRYRPVEVDEPDAVTMGQASLGFLNDKLRELKPSSYKMVVQHMTSDGKILDFFGTECAVELVRSPDVKAFRNHLIDNKLAPQTVNKILSTLKQFLLWCAEEGIIDSLPVVRRMREQHREHKGELSSYQMNRHLVVALRYLETPEKINQHHLFWVLILLRFCGLRPGEVLRLDFDVDTFDFRNGLIHLAEQKNMSAAPVVMSEAKPFLELLDRKGRVVQHRDTKGRRFGVDRITRLWRTSLVDAGITDITSHYYRHTFANRYFRAYGLDARQWTRHNSKQAMALYTHVMDREKIAKAKPEPLNMPKKILNKLVRRVKAAMKRTDEYWGEKWDGA